MKPLIVTLFSISLLTSGCAYHRNPVVDMTDVNPEAYKQDYSYCESYALSVDKGEAAEVGAANGAAVGAGSGAIVGAIEDGVEGAAAGAIFGALFGGITGAAEQSVLATEQQALVLRTCLKTKGYKVYDLET